MWTNVFKIGELQAVSWFQFLPYDSDLNPTFEKEFELSSREEQRDAAAALVLHAHLQLQKSGFLSTWTNSFVGPWDPSQGVHNPDEKIKVWLFLPGRHSSLNETAQAAVSKLRVVGTGVWLAPGDSEEVNIAFTQALRNSIERALRGLSYVRFGDVFTRCHSFSSNTHNFRRTQPTVEFVFSVTEDAIYAHAIISAKHIRGLNSDDMERVSKHRSSSSIGEGLPVMVAPNGMQGRITGLYPSDLVKQVYMSKSKASKGQTVGLPFDVAQSSSCQLRGQSCYLEVSLGGSSTYGDKTSDSSINQNKNAQLTILQRTFIYQPEAVLVPLMQKAFARVSVERIYHRNYAGTSLSELWPLWSVSGSWPTEYCLGFESIFNGQLFGGFEANKRYNSSSNSNSSSISSVSSTSRENDNVRSIGGGELEADADSRGSKRSVSTSKDQLENDNNRMAKRLRTGNIDAFDQSGNLVPKEVNKFASLGLNYRSLWDLGDDDDDETDYVIDMDAIILECGNLDEFLENDDLSLGELPGTKADNSQNLMLVDADSGVIGASPLIGGMDVDQKLSPINLTSFEMVNLPFDTFIEDNIQSKHNEAIGDAKSSVTANDSLMSSAGKFDHLTKAEAMMTVAPEYAAVETPTTEISSSIFRSPYLPRSKNVESLQTDTKSNVYSVSATSPCIDISEEKLDTDSCSHSLKLYSHIQSVSREGNQLIEETSPHQGEASAAFTLQKKIGLPIETGKFVTSQKTVIATEIECLMFQAAMGRTRHTLVSLRHHGFLSSAKLQENVLPDLTSFVTNAAYDVRKKDSLPARIAGDSEIGILDEPLNARVGVWRSVSVPKGTKPSNMHISENFSLLGNNNVLNDDGKNFSGQRQPLQEILDALPLLVQQSTSFVDVSLDMDDNESAYCWLALQEQKRRGFSCGPSMVHAGCGGLLAMSHSVDIAGVNLIDALSADVYPSSVISLLQSDIKTALKSAFGSLEGPLNLIDWCRGRGQAVDSGATGDGCSYSINDSKELSGIGEPMSPQGSGTRDESYQRRLNQEAGNSESEQQKCFSRVRPTIAALPLPSILVGYQDDWLKTSTGCLQFWEKAPLEPYASPKSVTYYALCPDSTLLTSAAADFFQQLGTIYETCKLGSHSPQICGNQMELSSEKYFHSGLVLVDCPHQVKTAGKNLFSVSSVSDYFMALSKFWNVKSFINALIKVIRKLKLTPNISQNQKEGGTNPCMIDEHKKKHFQETVQLNHLVDLSRTEVQKAIAGIKLGYREVVYVICPFPEPTAVLQTLLESSVALGSVVSQDKGRPSYLLNQVSRAQTSATSIDESSASNVLMLTGFNIPKLVLQIVTIDCLLKINKPFNELAVLKDIAFTVYNKARRVPRSVANCDLFPSSSVSGRAHASLLHVSSPVSGMWKDCTWDNSWQTSNKTPEIYSQEDVRYVFEPLFILVEPGSLERGPSSNMLSGVGLESMSSKSGIDDSSGTYMQSDMNDGSEQDKPSASLHCCYGWTEDWRWLICVWTDSRGELLDCNIFPFGGISGRQDTKVLQSLFVQILQQGCQILSGSSPDSGTVKPRDIIVTRIGCFFELECQEWQNAIYSVGGNDVKKWPLQLRRPSPEILSSNSNGTSLQQHELGLMQERNLPSSPGSSLYSPRAKTGFTKSGLSQANNKKQLLTGQTGLDNSRGCLQLVQSISLVGVCIDHSLLLMLPADSPSGTGSQTSNNSTVSNVSSYVEGFSAVKSLGSTPASYMIIPSPNLRSLTPTPLQLPTCLTSESPPLAHLLHSKGSAIPLSTGYVVSKAVPTIRKDLSGTSKSDWPSVLSVSLIDHYGSSNLNIQEKMRGKQSSRSLGPETVSGRDYEFETHFVLESVAAELHALSFMTTSPVYLERRSALPFHCDMLLRLRRLLHYAGTELLQSHD